MLFGRAAEMQRALCMALNDGCLVHNGYHADGFFAGQALEELPGPLLAAGKFCLERDVAAHIPGLSPQAGDFRMILIRQITQRRQQLSKLSQKINDMQRIMNNAQYNMENFERAMKTAVQSAERLCNTE